MKKVLITIVGLFFLIPLLPAKEKDKTMEPKFYTFTMKTINGKDKPLSDYKGKVVMVVNVASFCGNTPLLS